MGVKKEDDKHKGWFIIMMPNMGSNKCAINLGPSCSFCDLTSSYQVLTLSPNLFSFHECSCVISRARQIKFAFTVLCKGTRKSRQINPQMNKPDTPQYWQLHQQWWFKMTHKDKHAVFMTVSFSISHKWSYFFFFFLTKYNFLIQVHILLYEALSRFNCVHFWNLYFLYV